MNENGLEVHKNGSISDGQIDSSAPNKDGKSNNLTNEQIISLDKF